MKSHKDIYTNPQEHLSEDQLKRYQSGQMADAEMHHIERHLLDCELCSDALEGMALLDAGETDAAMAELKGRLSDRLAAEKPSSSKTYWPWAIAASVLLLFTASLFFLLPEDPTGKTEMRQADDSASEAAPLAGTNRNTGEEEAESAPPLAYTEPTAEDGLQADELPTDKPGAGMAEAADSKRLQSPRPNRLEISALPDMTEVADEEELDLDVVTEEIVFEEAPMEVMPQESDRFAGNSPTVEDAPLSAPTGKAESGRVSQNIAGNSRSSLVPKEANDSAAAYRTISGRVTDPAGEPIPGANIRLKGSQQGTVSNFDGEYSLRVPAADTSIEINFIGYISKTFPVGKADTRMQAVLEEDVQSLSEVVVTGRSTRRQRESTGAASTAEAITPPRPEGGNRRFKKYLREQQQYPTAAREAGVEGPVGLEFYVEKDGSISDIRITEPRGYGLDEEAVRLLQEGPAWKPATAGSENIRHKVTIEVPFKIK